MITAVDTNVLLDVFLADATFGPWSKDALRRGMDEGRLVACEVVWAEIAGLFPGEPAVKDAMTRLEIDFSNLEIEASFGAGAAWKAYRKRGGRRDRMIADFLIGAHANAHADRLLTRDRGFYRRYFKNLRLLDPSRS